MFGTARTDRKTVQMIEKKAPKKPKAFSKKVLLRLPAIIEEKLHQKKRQKKGRTYGGIIESAVLKFYTEVLPAEFQSLAENTVSELELKDIQLAANRRGVNYAPAWETEKEVKGTSLSLEILDKLKTIELWAGVSQSAAATSCLAYSFRLHVPANPDRGQLTRFMYPHLRAPLCVTLCRLRLLCEDEFL